MAVEARERVRLYIGGLGLKVEESDLRRALGSLGTVISVEMVRSRDRDFAYVEFEAASEASLRKVFSTYSGCKWKGGCLRVEKAKEDYMSRLEREWETQSSLNKKPEAELGKARQPVSLDLNIFFPRLRKLKSIPGKGTGKHKRSFQRVEAHPLAVLRLCDCEEHGGQPDIFDCEHDRYLQLLQKLEGTPGVAETSREARNEAEFSSQKTARYKGSASRDSEAKFLDRQDADAAEIEIRDKEHEEQDQQAESKEEVLDDDEDSETGGLLEGETSGEDIDEEDVDSLDEDDQPPATKWDQIFKAAANLGDAGERRRKLRSKEIDKKTELSSRNQRETTTLSSKKQKQGDSDHEAEKGSKACSWTQHSSWKALVGDTGTATFSFESLLGNRPVEAGVTGPSPFSPVEPEAARPSSNGSKKQAAVMRSSGDSCRKKFVSTANSKPSSASPSTSAARKSGEGCTFMRSADAEEEWLASKERLRSDYRAQHKAAVRMKRKLSRN